MRRRHLPWVILGAAVLLAAVTGATLGYFMRFDLPDVQALEDYSPPEMSRVLDSHGDLVGSFAEQRRLLVDYDEIPTVLQQALIAVEDSNFHDHTGVDLKGIARALWRDVSTLSLAQGASTLTQQLARNLFLHPDKTIKRKAQEAFLALEIERNYTKQEILRFYCNQIYTGHGRWGVEAASRHYFGKPARELTLPEAATIAGLIQRPEALSPLKHPERSMRRRNFVLDRMVAEGVLTEADAEQAKLQPIVTADRRSQGQIAPFFIEEVRRWIQQKFGSASLYKEGLEVRTTLDLRLQIVAEAAVDRGLRDLDKRQGWRGVQASVPAGEKPDEWQAPSWAKGVAVGQVHDAIVLEVGDTTARLRVGDREGSIGAKEIGWTGKKRPAELMSRGDLVRVRVREMLDGKAALFDFEQEPIVEAALIAIEPASGAIRALVGGFDFERSEFDRAIQARRQTGSAFKPLIYAAALAEGWTLADTLLDEPTVFLDRSKPEPYQPENYSNSYYARVTLRRALEKSANISTVKLLDAIGYDRVIDTSRRLGIGGSLQPYPSLALGVFGSSLVELTAAYGTFANAGVLVEPHLVESVRDSDGQILDRVEPAVGDAVDPRVAFLMNRVLRGVVTDGTGKAARSLKHPVAGKTGTTDNNTDAWFIGYSTRLAVGVWVGFDEPQSLGSRETGAAAALPIWSTFMRAALRDTPIEEFAQPPGIIIVSIDRNTGLKANLAADCGDVISEAFLAGSEPTRYCTKQHHKLLQIPYPFQRYAINERGQLQIPAGDLDMLLESELDVYLIDQGRRLEAYTSRGTITMPIAVVPGGGEIPLPASIREEYDVARWVGKDGRKARILWLGAEGNRRNPPTGISRAGLSKARSAAPN